MKSWIVILSLLFPFFVAAQYPSFTREYWESEEELARGKIVRGAALGATGVVLIWPTAVMISRAKENPHKYLPLSVLFGAASMGAMGHGFASIGYGRKQLERASHWVEQYDLNPDSTDLNGQRSDYLHYEEKSALKMTLFGSYTTSIAALMITNGIIQSTRSESSVSADDISVWPYYAVGGALLPMGIRAIVRSRKRDGELEELKTDALSLGSRFTPFVTLSPQGDALFGAFYTRKF